MEEEEDSAMEAGIDCCCGCCVPEIGAEEGDMEAEGPCWGPGEEEDDIMLNGDGADPC